MTMRIARSETIGGISAIEVRNRLRICCEGFRADWVTDTGYSKAQAAALIVGLLEGGYITVDTTRRNESTFPWYKLTDLGRSLVRASAAPPVKRQTADRTLREFMARVEEVNNSSRFLYRITEVVVYGSYLRGAASLGDLDLACEYEPTIENPDERTKATRKHFEESGRVYSRIGDDFHWSLHGWCCRCADKQAIAEYFHSAAASDEPLPPGYNIAPGTTQPVIRQARDTFVRELVGMRWGLIGFGSSGPDPKRATFNARCENLEKSNLWRAPLHKRRCLVPLSGFYEWRKTDKAPFRFTLRDQPLYALAGLWDAWKSPTGNWLQSFSIITVEANPVMSLIHDRMPAILSPGDYDEWLERGDVESAPVHLLLPFPGNTLEMHAANPKVGNVRNQGADLLEP